MEPHPRERLYWRTSPEQLGFRSGTPFGVVRTKLFVVKGGKAEERVVRAGVTVGEHQREIADGVAAGEEVAVTNVDRLENGAPVTVTRAEPVAAAAQ